MFGKTRKGASGGLMGVVFFVIMIVAVAIPVTQSVIDDQNLTGTTATVVGLIPLFLGIAGLAGVAKMAGLY